MVNRKWKMTCYTCALASRCSSTNFSLTFSTHWSQFGVLCSGCFLCDYMCVCAWQLFAVSTTKIIKLLLMMSLAVSRYRFAPSVAAAPEQFPFRRIAYQIKWHSQCTPGGWQLIHSLRVLTWFAHQFYSFLFSFRRHRVSLIYRLQPKQPPLIANNSHLNGDVRDST